LKSLQSSDKEVNKIKGKKGFKNWDWNKWGKNERKRIERIHSPISLWGVLFEQSFGVTTYVTTKIYKEKLVFARKPK